MNTKIILRSFITLFLIFILFNCSKNPIWDQFAKNPNIILGVYGSDAYVNIINEPVRIKSGPPAGQTDYGRITSVTFWNYDNDSDAKVKRECTNIVYYSSTRIKSYNENRYYEPGGSYKISVRDINYDALSRVISFNATVDGCKYSYP